MDPITALLEGETRVVELDQLKDNPRNPKGISKGKLDKLCKSLGHLGYLIPILVNEDYQIIDGHQRVKALRKEKYERVEVRVVDLDEDDELLALLASDETYGQFDNNLREDLYTLLEERKARLDILSNYKKKMDEEEDGFEEGSTIDPLNEVDIEYGVPIELGSHILICGDSTDPDIWKKVKEIATPYLLVTSPPYYNQRDYAHWENIQEYQDTMDKVLTLASNTMEDSIMFINIAQDLQYNLPSIFDPILEENGYSYLDNICWYKSTPNMSIQRYKQIRANQLYYPAYRWEPCVVYSRGLRHKIETKYINHVDNELLCNVWTFDTIRGEERIHPAQYPIELPENAMKCYSSKGDTIIDPFAGSGSTILAGENVGRRVIAIEMSPEYCALIVKRWNEEHK